MTAHTNNPRPDTLRLRKPARRPEALPGMQPHPSSKGRGMSPEQRHAQDPYQPFYDADAMETAAWLNGAEWARDPEQIERASCSVCDNPIADEPVECADWPGRWHHTECVSGCIECRGALQSERHHW